MVHDVIIVGGSYAGMSAALPLARARRSVLIIDAGLRRNRFATASHGLVAQDGKEPGRIASEARGQLLRYPTVEWRAGTATAASGEVDAFRVDTDDGSSFEGRRLVLAGGVRDILPEVPGLAERWGRSVFHCPYCHGYELDMGEIGVLASSALAMHQALMLPDWGRTTLYLNGAFEPDDQQLEALRQRGVMVERERVEAITGEGADLILRDGRLATCKGLFIQAGTEPVSPLATQLGCAMERGPLGSYVHTDGMKETTVRGVFSCGDMARGAGSVPLAVGDGAQAGVGVHRTLLFPDW